MSAADVAIAYALKQLGKPYKWGAAGPDEYDCSGLVVASYKQAGMSLPHGTKYLVNSGSAVIGSPLPGDLCFPYPGHVKLAISTTQTIEAIGKGVTLAPMRSKWWIVRRVSDPGKPTQVWGDNGPVIPSTTPSANPLVSVVSIFSPNTYIRGLEIATGTILTIMGLIILSGGAPHVKAVIAKGKQAVETAATAAIVAA